MSITRRLAGYLSDYGNRNSLGSRLRARRIAPLLYMIDQTFERHGFVKIVDVGGTETYWNIVPREYLAERRVEIVIVNLGAPPEDGAPFRFVAADGCDLSCFEDNSFHIAHSNSVIEHVGDWSRMVRFASELSRVAEKYFVQTPNYWFPIEPHCMTPFFHWLPRPFRVWLVSRFQLGHWEKAASVDQAVRTVESARLLNRGMFRELFGGARIITERFFFLPKSLIAVRR